MKNSQQAGYTLIEILVVSGLSIMLMLTISAMFMTFLIGNSSTNIRKTLNAEGSYALSQIAFILRNALTVSSECTGTPEPEVTVTSIDGGATTFGILSTGGVVQLASNSATLTSSSVTVSEGPNFTCNRQGGVSYVTVSFQLQHSSTSGTDALTEDFSTEVLVRN